MVDSQKLKNHSNTRGITHRRHFLKSSAHLAGGLMVSSPYLVDEKQGGDFHPATCNTIRKKHD